MSALDQAGRNRLADALGDSPWTVLTVHFLRRGLCSAYVYGDPVTFTAAITQWDVMSDEPVAFGTDPEGVWRLLSLLPGWRVVNVAEDLAEGLKPVMERELRQPVRLYGDIHHVLQRPPPTFRHPLVRLLRFEDLELVESAAPELQQGRLFGGWEVMLTEGVIAGAIDGGRLVATAQTAATTVRHADIGVVTLEPYRGQGISSAAASLVCEQVLDTGRTPVWSCGEGNRASLRVAEKLGFEPIGRRVYLIPAASPISSSTTTQSLQTPSSLP